MSITSVINLIKKDLYKKKNENIFYYFLYSSMLNYAISLELASAINLEKQLTFEQICKIIPKKFGCRSSVKSALDKGVVDGFFIKEINSEDKRAKIYKLSQNYSLMITEWHLSQKEYYTN